MPLHGLGIALPADQGGRGERCLGPFAGGAAHAAQRGGQHGAGLMRATGSVSILWGLIPALLLADTTADPPAG
jgi:hypothetical protein